MDLIDFQVNKNAILCSNTCYKNYFNKHELFSIHQYSTSSVLGTIIAKLALQLPCSAGPLPGNTVVIKSTPKKLALFHKL